MAKATTTQQPKAAVEALVEIVERAATVRFTDRAASLNDLVRMVGTASRLLRYEDADERVEVENAVVMALAKKRQMVS
jgi:hypothetical protein